MELSIIIPIYNERENLKITLNHLKNTEHFEKIEFIVAECPTSSDCCDKLCSDYENLKYYVTPNKGRAKQMNYGAKKASGNVFLFLHADVLLPIEFYNRVRSTLETGSKMGFFSYVFNKKSTLLRFNSYFTKHDGFFAGGGDQCQFFDRNTFESLGGYDEEYCIMEDFQMMRLIKKNNIPYNLINIPATVSARKYDKNSWLKINLINLIVMIKFRLGTSPERLRILYSDLLREGV